MIFIHGDENFFQSSTDRLGNTVMKHLRHITPVFHFFTPWKCRKNKEFLMFSGGMENGHWLEMG